ncbi:hypothetical protein [Agrobacterium salinitolerans]|uniref:hypothetical protein n=1 Tax=Agrobacterium salinitolerans TaxID=1183413 RepID=UPI001573BD5F|nr:hypothetical protein [Agrobacterium salinitolerans]NTA36691.1 site-specific DNA-methyltransferase [Agrobacterium salinitolerans]NTA36753.1 site-specific DNA-methyltransferase [Agrobacterium salinitolerans]
MLDTELVNSDHLCVSFENWTGNRSIPAVGTNSGANVIPFQSWRNFKEAFAPELIKTAFETAGRDVKKVVDPFGGSGTTALAAQFLGAHPTTIEVNPFLADLIEAKVCAYDFEHLVRSYSQIIDSARGKSVDPAPYLANAPKTFLEPGINGRYLFSENIASRFFAYRAAIDKLSDIASRRLFSVLLTGLSVSVSNAVVSGKGRRYRQNWKNNQVHVDDVDNLFEKTAIDAMRDLRRYEHRRVRSYNLLRGDSRELVTQLDEQDLAIFSPPYPNSFDYTDVYNIELWMGGYLRGSEDNRALRSQTLRSHVQIKRNFDYVTSSNLLVETLDRLESVKSHLWNRSIPAMIGAYFDDMGKILVGMQNCLVEGAKVFMVVGDSRYAYVNVPVAAILVEQARMLGYDVESSQPFRSMRASPQQGGQSELPETLITLRR